jgi:hypothetical protein
VQLEPNEPNITIEQLEPNITIVRHVRLSRGADDAGCVEHGRRMGRERE